MHKVFKFSEVKYSDKYHSLGQEIVSESEEKENVVLDECDEPKQDISSVKRECEEMLANARAEAAKIIEQAEIEAGVRANAIIEEASSFAEKTSNEMLENARLQVSEIEEQAKESGTALGKEQAYSEYSEVFTSLIEVLESMIPMLEDRFQDFLKEWEKDLSWLALQISRKALNKLVSEDELAMEDMIISAVDSVRDAEWLDVEVSENCIQLIERLKTELSGLKGVSVNSVMMPSDEARIQTDSGVIELSISERLDNIEKFFKRENI